MIFVLTRVWEGIGYSIVGSEDSTSSMEGVLAIFIKKFKMYISFDPVITLLEIYLKK